jgi:hypothetical protein
MSVVATAFNSVKRAITGEMQRDVDTIAAPFTLIADPRQGSIAELRRAVVARLMLERELESAYVADLVTDISGRGNRATFERISRMATKAVLTNRWDELADYAATLHDRHWLVRELHDVA